MSRVTCLGSAQPQVVTRAEQRDDTAQEAFSRAADQRWYYDGIVVVLWWYCGGIQMIDVTIERAGDPGGGNCPAWAGLALHA